jgi:hypothetical protein
VTKPGPKTIAAKNAVRRNATRHGILSEAPIIKGLESEADWKRHRQGMLDSLQPEGHYETVLAERIAAALWRLNRVTRYELEVTTANLQNIPKDMASSARYQATFGIPTEESITMEKVESYISHRILAQDHHLTRVMRYESHLHRVFIQTAHELEALQARRKGGQSHLTRLDISAPPSQCDQDHRRRDGQTPLTRARRA